MDCRPNTFSGTEGAVGLLHWFEKLESVFEMCECPEARKVKFSGWQLLTPPHGTSLRNSSSENTARVRIFTSWKTSCTI
ncbi:hypothetical protein Hanom_Chr17g01566211 [Helianthus anomalus]